MEKRLEPLVGRYELRLDAQGRLIVPTRMRRALSPDGAVTRVVVSIDATMRCLRVEPHAVWTERHSDLESLSRRDPRVRQMLVHERAHSDESTIDRQGRLRLASVLLEVARIVDVNEAIPIERAAVVLTGNGHALLVWAPKHWERFHSEMLAAAERNEAHANDVRRRATKLRTEAD